MKRVTPALLAIALLCHCVVLCAQEAGTGEALADSASLARPAHAVPFTPVMTDTARSQAPERKSPGRAVLYSAILPGAGQFYNGSYWKVPVILGFGIYFVSSWLDNNRRYQDYRDKYNESLQVPPGTGDVQLLSLREFYKEQRDTFAWYFIILYFLNLVDAYVDASLSDFDVGGDLSIRAMPETPHPVGSATLTGPWSDAPSWPSPGGRIEFRLRF